MTTVDIEERSYRNFEDYIGTRADRKAARAYIEHLVSNLYREFLFEANTPWTKYDILNYVHNRLEKLAIAEIIPAILWIDDNEITFKHSDDPTSVTILLPESLETWLNG